MRRIPLMVGLLALVSIYVSAAPKQTVAVAFETSRVTVSGVSPGGNVLLYGLGRDFVRVSPELLRWAKVEAASTTDGTATFDIGRAVPARSVWIVVDVSTGAYAVATPQASFRRERAADQASFVINAAGNPQFFKMRGTGLDLLVVMPGVGGWLATVGASPGTDASGKAGWFSQVDFAKMVPIGSAPPAPEMLTGKELVVAIDPDSFEFSVAATGGR